MSAKTKILTILVLLLTIAIIPMACAPSPKVQLPILREASDFTLTNQDGLEVRLSDFRGGKVVVMDFIYTSCPDVCGMLNHKLKIVHDKLEEGRKQDLVIISVSFDPVVDTPEVLKQYAIEEGFDIPGWQFLTGTEEQIRQVADDYGVVYELVVDHEHESDEEEHEHEGSQESVRGFTHNIVVVLIDRDGMVRKTYGQTFSLETEMISDITSLLSSL